jgi:flagellar assembly protein FliH
MTRVIRSARVEQQPVILPFSRAPRAEDPVVPGAEISPAESVAPQVDGAGEMPAEEDTGQAQEELRRQAFEDGYRDGFESGAKEAQRELAARLGDLARIAGSIRQALMDGIAGAEDAMVEIGFAAACKVIGAAARSEDGVREIVREAMRHVAAKEPLVLRMSARDVETLGADESEALSAARGARVDIVADDRVTNGGCLIETESGNLDARLEVQLRQLLDALVAARTEHGE